MDLLETILRSGGLEEFLETFKANKIDTYSLKLLKDADLQLLGIKDDKKREQFIKIINNLQIPAEKVINMKVDAEYALIVLNNISLQLQKQFANLTYIFKREDVDICDIELIPAVICLHNVLNSMQTSLNTFEQKVLKKPEKKSRKTIIIPSLIVSSTTLVVFCWYLLSK